MKMVEKGDFSHKVTLNCGGEIESLSGNFNAMLDKIQHLIMEVYETRLKKLDSEFKALQAQVNPHFLYNTLESINCLAQIKEEGEISEMVQGLARMFRYSTKQEDGIVTLADELNHVRNYILLQAIRYEDKFSIEYAVPSDLLKTRVIKFMLQPLVENALYHGIEKITRKGLIRIEACQSEQSLEVSIHDNGCGIDPERLSAIVSQLASGSEHLSESDKGNGSIGIINIHLRIRLYFGDAYGIRIHSIKGSGTTVTVVLPYDTGHSKPAKEQEGF